MKLPTEQQKYIRLYGGLDLSSPPMAKTPGYAVTASNVEPILNGGWRRTFGYDRFDGRPSPSETKGYYQLTTNGEHQTEYALYESVTWDSGSGFYLYRDGNAIFIVSDSAPALDAGAIISIAGESYTLARKSSRSATTRSNSFKAAGYASDYRRSLIGEVPGVGDIRGVVAVGGSVFAFRDADALNGAMYKATASGWVAVSNNIVGFGSTLSVRDGYGIDDGDLTMKRIADASSRDAVAQMSADGITGNICLPVGESCVAGDYLVIDTGVTYTLTLLSAISGAATTFAVETTGNQMAGVTLDASNNAGWYVMVSGKLLPVISYLVKTGDETKCVLTVSNPHAINLAADSAVEVRKFTAFCEVTASNNITIPPGGDYKAVVHNFYGSPDMRRAYAVNGVGRAMEIRESGRIVPLFAVDDANLDKPTLVEAHKEHLFLAFRGGQYQHSAMANPLTWSGLLGAEAFSVGDEITGLKSIQGGVLFVGCKNRTLYLSGTNSSDWQQIILSESVGCINSTLQSLFIPIALSDNGLTRLDRVQEYGDFTVSLLDPDNKITPIIKNYQWMFSSQIPSENQYRLYSTSGINLICTIGQDGSTQFSTFRYPAPVSGVWRFDESKDRNFFALSGRGYVYETNKGATSFDGSAIRWTLKTAFMHMGAPGAIKSWRSVQFEQSEQSIFSCDFWWNIDYRSGSSFSSQKEELDIGDFGSALWNNASWNQFYWNAEQSDETGSVQLTGSSASIGFSLSDKTDHEPNFYLSGMLVTYIPRRLKRG